MNLRIVTLLLFSLSLLSATEYRADFENATQGTLPKRWVVAATHPGNRLAKWQVTIDETRPKSDRHILTLTQVGNSMFNLCYRPDIRMKNGHISVLFHANSGRIDQGGGIMWRVHDSDNYYVARFNPLEDNFRFYSVIKGHRTLLCTIDGVHLAKGWHAMAIDQQDDRFTGFLDGKKMLECKDNLITQSGGVGVWTKADAATSFDDFVVKARE